MPGLKELKWQSPTEPQEWQHGLRISWITRRMGGANKLHCCQAQKQESWLGAAGPGAHLLFCFAINCELLHDPATPFLGAHGNSKSSVSPSPEEQHRLISQKSLKFGVLKLNHMPETKNSSDTGRVNARFRWKLETQEEWLLFCEGSLKSLGSNFQLQN